MNTIEKVAEHTTENCNYIDSCGFIDEYICSEKYLYEIIEDYKKSSSITIKKLLFQKFCDAIWNCGNEREIKKSKIHYTVCSAMKDTKIGKLFSQYQDVYYNSYRSMCYKDKTWSRLLRQKINNLYTKYCDENVILQRDYIRLLHVPKNLYYKYLINECFNQNVENKIYDEEDEEIEDIRQQIEKALLETEKLFEKYKKHKICSLSWKEYQCLIEDFLQKAFDNCVLIDEYEKEHNYKSDIYDFHNEDNFYIKYFCKTLEGEMSKWQKKHYNVRRGKNIKYKRCKECGALIENTGNRKMYCLSCAQKREKERKKKRYVNSKSLVSKNKK